MSVIEFSYDVLLSEVLTRLDLPPQVHECHFDWDTGLFWSNMSHLYEDVLGVAHRYVVSGSSPYSVEDAKSVAGLQGVQFLKSVYGFEIGDFDLVEVLDLRVRLQRYNQFEMAGPDAFADLTRNYEELRFKYGKAMQLIMAISQNYKLFDFSEHLGAP